MDPAVVVLARTPARRVSLSRFSISGGQLWAALAVLIPVLIAVSEGLHTVDLAYHVRAGLDAIGQGSLVWSDSFTFTASGHTWVNQQWLSQLIFAVTFEAGGFVGLLLLRAMLAGLLFSLVFGLCRSQGASMRASSWLTLGAFAVAMTSLTLRPQLLGVCLFALALRILQRRSEKPALVWWLVPLTILWANVHGSFVFVLVLLVIAKLQDRIDGQRSRITVPLLATVVLATLVNPAGPWIWVYVVGLLTNPMMARVTEWFPPQIGSLPGILFFGSAIAVAVFLARRAKRIELSSLLPLCIFLSLALSSKRSVVWWAIVAVSIIPAMLGRAPNRPEERRLVNTFMVGAFAATAVVAMMIQAGGSGTATLSDAPRGITTYLRNEVAPDERMLNPQRWGSWFELALPGHKTFIDSRIEFFPGSVWTDYLRVAEASQGWENILDRWRIEVVVVDRAQMRGARGALDQDPDWTIAYQDRDGYVFRRAASATHQLGR
ncbi:MAG: hypothetical protein ACRDI3_09050 [Actinomycetota bacterium]